MLVVPLEIWPGGARSARYQIGKLEIWNVSDLAPVSDYGVRLTIGSTVTTAEVTGHKRSDGATALIRKALEALGV